MLAPTSLVTLHFIFIFILPSSSLSLSLSCHPLVYPPAPLTTLLRAKVSSTPEHELQYWPFIFLSFYPVAPCIRLFIRSPFTSPEHLFIALRMGQGHHYPTQLYMRYAYCRNDKFCSSVFVPVRIIWKRYFIPGCRVQGLVSAQRSHTARQKKRHTDPSWQDPPRFKKKGTDRPTPLQLKQRETSQTLQHRERPLKVSNTERDLSPSDKDRFSPLSWPTTWPQVTQGKINTTLFKLLVVILIRFFVALKLLFLVVWLPVLTPFPGLVGFKQQQYFIPAAACCCLPRQAHHHPRLSVGRRSKIMRYLTLPQLQLAALSSSWWYCVEKNIQNITYLL